MNNQPFNQAAETFLAMPGDEMEPLTQNPGNMPGDEMNLPAQTGRFLVLFAEDAHNETKALLQDKVGLNVSTASANEANMNPGDSAALIYPKLGVMVVSADPDRLNRISSLSSKSNSPILAIEAEQVISIEPPITSSQQVDRLADFTWGLLTTKVKDSNFSGKGIKVAILDTGLDLNHPDFANRTIIRQSFVEGENVQDEYGHGTHCAGTACGPRQPKDGKPGYGVAYEADIYIAKVLNNRGSGTDQSIIDGMNWAFENRCQIISMSLGSLVAVGAGYSPIYETLAQRLLKNNTLIIAAAGNDSRRNQNLINPVSRPANCPSIMAVGAIDANFQIANFSNRRLNNDGGDVDIAAPGVNVYSSWPLSVLPKQYNTINGTSMATPHVAGIAALLAEAKPNITAKELWQLLINTSVSLSPLGAIDVGKGLVQAP